MAYIPNARPFNFYRTVMKEITDKIQSLEGKHISKEVISANQNKREE